MPWIYRKEPTAQEERKARIFFAVLFGFVAFASVLAATQEFSEGKSWVGARHLAMAFTFGLLSVKGPQLWSRGSLGVKGLAIGAFLLYAVLYTVQIILPLTATLFGR